MNKYKLLEDFAGLRAGYEFYAKDSDDSYSIAYKGGQVTVKLDSGLFEKANQPLIYTNIGEVYRGRTAEPIYADQRYWLVKPRSSIDNLQVENFVALKGNNYDAEYKRFLTEKDADDYIKLQRAIKRSGLIIGEQTANRNTHYLTFSGSQWQRSSAGKHTPRAFFMKDGFPCFTDENYYKLEDYYASNLTFGGKEVTLQKLILTPGEVRITCDTEHALYSNCKKFIEAAKVVRAFKFGNKSLRTLKGDDASEAFETLHIGCTGGTMKEAEAILAECEKLLRD